MVAAVTVGGVAFNPVLLALGICLLAIGWWLRRWADRHNLIRMGMDSARKAALGAATSALGAARQSGGSAADKVQGATQAGLKAGLSHVPGDLGDKLAQVQNAGSNTARAKVVAGTAARGYLAPFVGLAGLVLLLAGLAFAGLAFVWG